MIILKIFDFFRERAIARWASLIALTLAILASILRLSYKVLSSSRARVMQGKQLKQ